MKSPFAFHSIGLRKPTDAIAQQSMFSISIMLYVMNYRDYTQVGPLRLRRITRQIKFELQAITTASAILFPCSRMSSQSLCVSCPLYSFFFCGSPSSDFYVIMSGCSSLSPAWKNKRRVRRTSIQCINSIASSFEHAPVLVPRVRLEFLLLDVE